MTIATAQQQVQALFVSWRQPETRAYFPVGRLVLGANHGRPPYEYAYVKGALEARKHGFEPFLAFPDLYQAYRSEELFPLFANRLMSPKRPDFERYVANLGLASAADPIAILARSGGRRATDSLELFEIPHYDPARRLYETFFLAHGLRYLPDSSHQRLERLAPREQLFLMHDYQNTYDPRALVLRTADRVVVGYFPSYLLEDTWTLIQTCGTTEVFVAQVNPAPAPLEERLLCRVESCWPADFRPYCTEPYKPIPSEAVTVDCGRQTPSHSQSMK